MSGRTLEVRAVTYEIEVPIDGSREQVWNALTRETNAWWLPDFHMVGEGSVVSFDARAGGVLVEETPDGGSLLWYTVHMAMPLESLHLVGHVAPEWGGPATSLLRLRLDERDAGTVLSVTDALFGHVGDATVSSLKEGWGQLFGDGLRRHVEDGAEG